MGFMFASSVNLKLEVELKLEPELERELELPVFAKKKAPRKHTLIKRPPSPPNSMLDGGHRFGAQRPCKKKGLKRFSNLSASFQH